MFNSKWQMNRVGLIDFWYYDEEEFYFLDGRLLLRGSNGSGKSVTMQSFIPLLLDGNMRPERLDPFGSRARKMENYLLEEGDGREERTGYLYIECKRLEGENYLTIGIGMRARKNKKLDVWYFYITDGRRIGKDLYLYKDLQNKITYTKQELKNKIGEGGRVLESQNEYMESVNRLLFGFETGDQYKELLELLIQLRTPKLSKDFKPTVINDILSSSLQTLSEEDLRPMSEAIENMDELKTNLDTLKDSVQAARHIERVYDQYNQIMLYEKANVYKKENARLKSLEKTVRETDEEIISDEAELLFQKERYESLKQEEAVLNGEKETLNTSDAAKLKEQEYKLSQEMEKAASYIQNKEQLRDEKNEKRIELEHKIRLREDERDQQENMQEELLEEMEELLTDIPFDDFVFLKKELEERKEENYSFKAHSQLLDSYTKKVDDGITVLKQEKLCQERYDVRLREVDVLREERDQKERTLHQHLNQLHEIKDELTEKFYVWEKQNGELKVPAQVMQELSAKIEAFTEQSDYGELKDLVRQEYLEQDEKIRNRLIKILSELEKAKNEEKEKREELERWIEKKDPEPERRVEVEKNRQLLTEMGIPYEQFYKTIDFDSGVSGEQAGRLEEALLSMGILDALIIPAEYRKQVLKLDKGVCDRYIFSDVSCVKKNLMSLLDVDNPDQDMFRFQNISRILGSIGYMDGEEAASTWIDENGNYRLGILEGTVTKGYEQKYIGVRTRAAFRQKMLDKLQAEADELSLISRTFSKEADELKGRQQTLKDELEQFPGGEDLRVAAREYASCELALLRTNEMIERLKEKLHEEGEKLTQIKLQVAELCGRAYLTARTEIFEAAKEALLEYRGKLTELQLLHGSYLNGLEQLKGFTEQLESIELDIDEVLYDLVRIKREQDGRVQAMDSIKEQLSLTNYEEIKERLNACVKRLLELPKEREQSVSRQAALIASIEQSRKKRISDEEERAVTLKKCGYLRAVFEKECNLQYVEKTFVITEDWEDQAEKVCQMLSGDLGGKKQSDLLGAVQEAYHQNRGYLLEYSLTLDSLFEEEEPQGEVGEMPSARRVDITGKYRGNSVKFKELIARLLEDMENLARLLSEKDRELFEDILANTISKKIRSRIHSSNLWVAQMNKLMESMQTSSGLKLSLKWKSKRAEKEEQLDTRELVALLQRDAEIMKQEDLESLSGHFRSKIEEARKISDGAGSFQSFHAIMREILDYRKWFEFQLEFQKTGEVKKELTDRAFFTFSGGEKAMSMYVPLFSAVVAKYAGARADAPRIISLDEAFAGVDEMNIKDMFRLMVNFEFNFMINSQILWGDYETVPAIAIYQLLRPENAKYVGVISYVWNGRERIPVDKVGEAV